MYKVIYLKANGDIIERIRDTYPRYSIGEETSMGWVVLDILHRYNEGYYSYSTYRYLVKRERR